MLTLADRERPAAPTLRVRRPPTVSFVVTFPFTFLVLAMIVGALTEPANSDRISLWILALVFAAPGFWLYWSNRLELTGRGLRRVRPYWPGRTTEFKLNEITGVFLRASAAPFTTRWMHLNVVVESNRGRRIDLGSRNRDLQLMWTQPELANLLAELESRGVPIEEKVWDYLAWN
jgi:hypothetical protein